LKAIHQRLYAIQIYGRGAITLSKVKENAMAERMSNADNFWLSMDQPTNLMVITGFMEFKKPLDFNRLYATIDSRLASFPALSTKNRSAKIRPWGPQLGRGPPLRPPIASATHRPSGTGR
jgi:hypothetical protein